MKPILLLFKHAREGAVAALLALLCMGGCIRGNGLDDCPMNASMIMRALDNAGNDITATGQCGDVMLFAYDNYGKYLWRKNITVAEVKNGKRLDIRIPAGKELHIVAWSNLADTVTMLNFHTERTLRDNSIRPFFDNQGYALLLSDVYYAGKRISKKDIDNSHIIELRRALAQMHVAVVGLPADADPRDYTLEVSDEQAALNFENSIVYKPGMKYRQALAWQIQGKMMETKEAFRTLPALADATRDTKAEQQAYKTVKLYHKGKQLIDATKDIEGKIIAPKAGERLNILLDLNREPGVDPAHEGKLEVRAVVSPWNEVVIWKNW